MIRSLRTTVILTFILAVSALGSGCIISSGDDATLTIDNASDFVIEEIRIARTDVNEPYGPNLIPRALFPDESITISLDCDFYDILIVDELGTECELINFDLCFTDAIWVITNSQLARCDGFAARLQEMGKLPEAEKATK